LAFKRVAILRFDHFVALSVVQSRKVLVVDVFDVDPFELEVSFELERVVLPPEGESFFMVARLESSDTFEHTAFDCTEEEVGVCVVIDFALPQLFDFTLILGSGCPDAVLNGLHQTIATLCTLSSLALLMTIPLTFWSCSPSW